MPDLQVSILGVKGTPVGTSQLSQVTMQYKRIIVGFHYELQFYFSMPLLQSRHGPVHELMYDASTAGRPAGARAS